ncbi:unnamed protein product [Mucor hiemalis]
MTIEGSLEGWTMVSISSLSCVFGASVVVILGDKKCISSKKFLSSSMALGSGVLMFNSLYTLLPASQQKLNSNFLTFLCFFIGVIFTVLITWLIQWCTPHAIHTCDPIASVQQQLQKHSNTSSSNPSINELMIESQPLLHNQHDKPHHHHHRRESIIEYGSVLITSEDNDEMTTEKNDYFLIGMQTAIAICIHKFPEGLIMFVSNESSSQLGLSVAAAMTIHNLIEGFLIALPLYYATGSRLSAFGYASFLGGLSQPLGAILGLFAIRNVDSKKEQLLFGIIFGVVSGMMCLISVQSMLPQAIKADATHRLVPTFFFIGIFLVGLSSLLQSI